MDPESVKPEYLIFIQKNWLSIVFGISGLAGSLYGYLSWKSAQKEKQIYGYLFDLAEKNIDKKITEKEIAKQKKEVEKVSQEVESLQEQIRKDIPKEARRAVLKDRLNANINLLNQYFQTTKKIKEELSQLGSSPEIPPELLKAIESEISPEYLLKEKQANLKTYLTIVTTSAAIVAAVVPYEIGRLFSFFLLLIAAPIIILLFKSSLPLNKILRKKLLFDISIGLLVFASIAGLLFSGIMSYVLVFHINDIYAIFFTAISIISTIACATSAAFLHKKTKLLYVDKNE